MEVEKVKTIDEEFTRTNYKLNSKGFSDEQLLRRERDMKLMCQSYPGLTVGHAELIWNYVERTGKDKIQENIKNGTYDQKSDTYIRGGLLKSGRVYDKDAKDPLEAELN